MTARVDVRLRPEFGSGADAILHGATTCKNGVPGVVAMLTSAERTLYAGAFGVRDLAGGTPMTPDTVMAIYSCTKALTATAVMQLVERGTIRLDDPARAYVPDIAAVPVLDGFDSAGRPRLRRAATDITIEQLLLHTAGFGYEFFNADLLRFARSPEAAAAVIEPMPATACVLLFDPGTRWEYGRGVDWVSRVVEHVHGKPFAAIVRDDICAPLDMHDTGFRLTPAMAARRATIHQRAPDRTLTPMPEAGLPADAQPDLGGSGLFSTVADYLRFIRMILAGGRAPSGERILAPQTVEGMAANGLGDLCVAPLPGTIARLTNDAEFFPGLRKTWGYSWMINAEPAPTGRPAGALGWAGLANLFYWIDPSTGIGGMWATQILPFIDDVSLSAYLAFETAVYAHIA
jgi:methyl acetate hydrolase